MQSLNGVVSWAWAEEWRLTTKKRAKELGFIPAPFSSRRATAPRWACRCDGRRWLRSPALTGQDLGLPHCTPAPRLTLTIASAFYHHCATFSVITTALPSRPPDRHPRPLCSSPSSTPSKSILIFPRLQLPPNSPIPNAKLNLSPAEASPVHHRNPGPPSSKPTRRQPRLGAIAAARQGHHPPTNPKPRHKRQKRKFSLPSSPTDRRT